MVNENFKGRSVKELQEMNSEKLEALLTSRVRRKLKRGLTEEQKEFLNKLKNREKARTHLRDMVVLPEMIGKKVSIHNGKEFIEIEVTADMMGHLLGEFALTRKRVAHSSPGMGATRSSKYVPLK